MTRAPGVQMLAPAIMPEMPMMSPRSHLRPRLRWLRCPTLAPAAVTLVLRISWAGCWSVVTCSHSTCPHRSVPWPVSTPRAPGWAICQCEAIPETSHRQIVLLSCELFWNGAINKCLLMKNPPVWEYFASIETWNFSEFNVSWKLNVKWNIFQQWSRLLKANGGSVGRI